MNNSHNAIDYVVTKKATGTNLLARILLIILYVVIGVGIIVILNTIFPVIGVVAGGVVAPFVIYILFALTWTHVSYDLKYQIYTPTANLNEVPHTVIEFARIKRNKKKENVDNVVYRREIRDAELIAPYTEANKSKYTDGVKQTIDFRSSPVVKNDCYFLRFPEKDGSKTVVIVEVVSKMVDSFKYHNKDVTEVENVSR